MSAIGPYQTWRFASHRSAFEGSATMTVSGGSLSRSLSGAKQTDPFAPHASACDPKRRSGAARPDYGPIPTLARLQIMICYSALRSLRGKDAVAEAFCAGNGHPGLHPSYLRDYGTCYFPGGVTWL